MDANKRLVQIVLLSRYGQIERARFLLREFIPHKVYFLRDVEPLTSKAGKDFKNVMEEELKKELPRWVAKKSINMEVPFSDFGKIFAAFLEITTKEKDNNVIINAQGTSIPAAFAAVIAAAMTGAKFFWVEADRWELSESGKRKIAYPVGTRRAIEIKIPFVPQLPKSPEKDVLLYLRSKGGKVREGLGKMTVEIGLKKLGARVKRPRSGVVKLSKIIQRLRNEGYVSTRRSSRKKFEVSLTEKGKVIAEAVSLF